MGVEGNLFEMRGGTTEQFTNPALDDGLQRADHEIDDRGDLTRGEHIAGALADAQVIQQTAPRARHANDAVTARIATDMSGTQSIAADRVHVTRLAERHVRGAAADVEIQETQ